MRIADARALTDTHIYIYRYIYMKLNDHHFRHLLSRIGGHLKKKFENRVIGTTSIATFPLGNLLK